MRSAKKMSKFPAAARGLFLLSVALFFAGCQTQVTLVNYDNIQKRARWAIGAKYPALNVDELRLQSIKSEMSSSGAEVIEVDFEQPRASLYIKDLGTNGQQRLVNTPAFIVRMSNSGQVQEVIRSANNGL